MTTHGIRNVPIFVDDLDRRAFLQRVGDVVGAFRWSCGAFCLITTHYPLPVRTRRANLAAGMQWLNGRYAQSFNRRHGHKGHLFRARYQSVLVVDEPHGLEVSRYIALNPVRAGLCSDPATWPWSSYAATVGLAPTPRFLTPHDVLAPFGEGVERARHRFRAFVEDALYVDTPAVA